MTCDLCGNESHGNEICEECIIALKDERAPSEQEFMVELGIEYLESQDLDEDFKCAIAEEVYFSEPTLENLQRIFDIADKNSKQEKTQGAKRLHLPSEVYISIHSKILDLENTHAQKTQFMILEEAAKGIEIHGSAKVISHLNHTDISVQGCLDMRLSELINHPSLVGQVNNHVSYLLKHLEIHFHDRDNYSSRIFYYAYQTSQNSEPFFNRLKNNRGGTKVDLPEEVLLLKSRLKTLRKWSNITYDILTGHPSTMKISEGEETTIKPVSDDDAFWSLEARFSWLSE